MSTDQPRHSTTCTFTEKAKQVAHAFSRSVGKLNELLCTGKNAVQVIEAREVPVLRVAKYSPSETLRQSLFPCNSISYRAQKAIQQEIETQAHALEIVDSNPLFTFPDLRESRSIPPGIVYMGPVVRPGHTAKLVLADLYREKYGLDIHIQRRPIELAEHLADLLLKKLENSKLAPVGLVLHSNKVPTFSLSASNDDDLRRTEQDHRDHVIPIIVQSTSRGIDVINLDVLAKSSDLLIDALCLLKNTGLTIRLLSLHTPQRQADGYSCHTDAMQVLKDALVAHQSVGGNLYRHYWKQFGVSTKASAHHKPLNDLVSSRLIDLPTQLYKPVQRSQALFSYRVSASKAMATKMPSSNPAKSQSMGEHRERFSVYVEELGKPVNNFLLFKGYRNAFKVIDQLKKFPDTHTRDQYIQGIQIKHGFD